MPQVEDQTTNRPSDRVRGPRGAARCPGVKPGTQRLVGTLVRIHEAGYGFIRTTEGEFYINVNSMRDRTAWAVDQVLSFMPGEPRDGKATPAYDAIALRPTKA